MDIWDILLDTRVLVTFIICAILGGLAVWAAVTMTKRRYDKSLTDQRHQQEEAVSRILDSFSKSKDEIIADYEAQISELRQQASSQEKEIKRLKDRVAQGGLLGLFGGGQREVISSLLLENEQLHELLSQKQEQIRDLMQDMTGKLLDRLDEQVQENAKAIRYKQVLLSAFLQQEEARKLLDRFLADGRLSSAEHAHLLPASQEEPPQAPPAAEADTAAAVEANPASAPAPEA